MPAIPASSAQLAFTEEGSVVTPSAIFDPTGAYRYLLSRRWSHGPICAFVMLNPSTADAARDDPTVRRCALYARRWGYAGLDVVNIFALRSTDPQALRTAPDPIGPLNDKYILQTAQAAALVLLAWGNHGAYLHRSAAALDLLAGSPLHCLATTKSGEPAHPLYQRGNLIPSPFPSARPA